jgi:hypothetical protein
MSAAGTGNLRAVKALLVRGAEVNAKEGWKGQTALMWAAAEGHTPVVDALIEMGAAVNARSKGGFTPLLFAVRQGSVGAVRRLLAANANSNDVARAEATSSNSTARTFVETTSALALAVINALRGRRSAAGSGRRPERRRLARLRAPRARLDAASRPETRYRRRRPETWPASISRGCFSGGARTRTSVSPGRRFRSIATMER